MAIVGDAYVVVHAITSGVKKDIENGFKGVDREAENAGKRVSRSFSKGFNNTPIANSLSNMFGTSTASAIRAADAFKIATQTGYFLGSAITAAVGAIGALANGLVSLVAVTLAAAPAFAVLTNAIFGLVQVGGALAIAFRGVSTAIQAGVKAGQTNKAQTIAITKATLALKRAREDLAQLTANAAITEEKAVKSLADAQRELNLEREKAAEQLQQLAFDSEDAAISEQKAALDLEKARETLARVSDLPPNSRARKEAELAFSQADLNYRRAIDKNNDLKKTETKNAAMGNGSIQDQIAGQQDVIDASYKAEQASVDLTKTKLDNTKSITRATEDLAQQEKDLEHLKAGGSAADAYAVALNNLSASAQEFTKYIVGLKGTGKDLQESIGKELFPRLETAIQNLIDKLLPVLKPLLGETGKALGDVAIHLSDVLSRADNLDRIKSIWETNDTALTIFGDSIGNLIDDFLLLAVAAEPLVLEFANWTKNITGAWKATLEADTKSGKLSATLEKAADVVRKLGTLFRETFGAIGNLVNANIGPGSGGYYLLDYLTKAMTGLKNLSEVDGKSLKQFFLDGAINAGKVLDILGFLTTEILKIGASKEFGQFADSIKGAFPALETIFNALKEGLPSFGNLVKQIADFIAIVTSGDSIKIFFDVLGKGLETLNKFLKTDIGQLLVNLGNYIIPVVAGLALMGSGVGLFGKVIVGNIAKLEGFVGAFKNAPDNIRAFITSVADVSPALAGKLSTAFEAATHPIQTLTKAFNFLKIAFLANPFVAIGIAIVAFIAIFVILYKKNEAFRELVDKVWAAIKNAIGVAVDAIVGFFNNIMEFGAKIWAPIYDAVKFVWDLVFAYYKTIFTIYKTIVEIIIGIGLIIWDFLYDKIQAVWGLVAGWWNDTILPFITGIVTKVAEFGAKIWDWVFDKLSAVWGRVKGFWDNTVYPFIKQLADNFKNNVGAIWGFIFDKLSAVWDRVKGFWDNTVYPFIANIKDRITSVASGMWDGLKTGLQTVLNFIISGINSIIRVINFMIKGANAIKIGKAIPTLNEISPIKLAKGGVISPSAGGTLARIGEAGKSERVEPLDPQGLSVRDRAIIAQLSGNSGATINMVINPSPGMDERELAAIVSRQISYQLRKGAA